MLKKALFLGAITFSLFFHGCSDSAQEAEEVNTMVSGTTFNLTDLADNTYVVEKKGNDFILKNYEDKVVIYDVFATWCPPCRAAAPSLTRLQNQFANDLLILGISIEEDKSTADIQDYKTTYGADYTIVNSKDNVPLSRSIASTIKVGQRFPIPLMVMYKNGQYVTHYVGAVPEEMIISDVKKAIGQ